MTFHFRPAKRENVPLLIGAAGGTGSGKTYSALRLARGIANGQPFAGIDTENGRMNHYADLFPELHVAAITAPFRPAKYADAIEAALAHLEAQNVPVPHRVVLVDSMSHEWAGDGGCLDWQEEIMDGKESRRLMSWIEPKKAHKRMVTRLLQVNAHVILCFRAELKVDMRKNAQGQWEFIPKPSLTGLDGWLPISEKMLPYELTASFLLMADTPGVPRPIKLQEQHRPLVPLDAPLTEQVGRALAEWAAGGAGPAGDTGADGTGSPSPAGPLMLTSPQRRMLFAHAADVGVDEARLREIIQSETGQDSTKAIPRAQFDALLARIDAEKSAPVPESGQSAFESMVPHGPRGGRG